MSTSRAPDPIPVSEQYKVAFDEPKDEAEEHEADDGATGDAPKVPQSLPKKRLLIGGGPTEAPKKKRLILGAGLGARPARDAHSPDAVPAAPAPDHDAEGMCPDRVGVYRPHHFREQREIFLIQSKKDGMTHKQACEAWCSSTQRSELLAHMSLPELKRRRFVDKNCTVNPFRLAALGG